jgi:hypothetical protein
MWARSLFEQSGHSTGSEPATVEFCLVPRRSPIAAVVFAAMLLSGCSHAGSPEIFGASVEADGRKLVLTVGSCHADLSAEVDESPSRVIVSVIARNGTNDDCADLIIVHLDQPLSARRLLERYGGSGTRSGRRSLRMRPPHELARSRMNPKPYYALDPRSRLHLGIPRGL